MQQKVASLCARPLVQEAGDLWTLGTEAPFLRKLADGTLPEAVFARWLEQDYHFVRALTSFQAVLAAKAPRTLLKTLIGGLSALEQELTWFETHAEKRGLDLDCDPGPVCRRYADFLIATAYRESVEIGITALFAVEAAYAAAWSNLSPEGPYEDFIRRWSREEFLAYCLALADIAESVQLPGQQAVFNRVMQHERDFWQMVEA
jgi:thiaminase/transcriptional activator TenA